ncbi:MAG: hypothetical protein N2C14_11575, partial [Planctomycetales bacterium]
MARYALTIFLSAFLLFQVQPMIGKFILPWFGGTPAVWTSCMLFFQVVLLAGYAYAHGLSLHFPRRTQALVHLGLLTASVVMLWFFPPSTAWKPEGGEFPLIRILALLAMTIGAPYLVLSTTGPLMQDWFAHTNPDKSPYWLYALSNTGSLLALVSYPFLVEPLLSLPWQTFIWKMGHLVFVGCCAWCAYQLWTAPEEELAAAKAKQDAKEAEASMKEAKGLDFGVRQPHADRDPDVPPSWADWALWCGLSAVGSLMLLATTNQLCQDVAAVPFLWILPLALYLLTFILCFQGDAWYGRGVSGLTLMVALFIAMVLLTRGVGVELWQQVAGYSFVLFMCCICLHGELVQSKPHPRYLTSFYLLISTGGALGGIFVSLIAPTIFQG